MAGVVWVVDIWHHAHFALFRHAVAACADDAQKKKNSVSFHRVFLKDAIKYNDFRTFCLEKEVVVKAERRSWQTLPGR